MTPSGYNRMSILFIGMGLGSGSILAVSFTRYWELVVPGCVLLYTSLAVYFLWKSTRHKEEE